MLRNEASWLVSTYIKARASSKLPKNAAARERCIHWERRRNKQISQDVSYRRHGQNRMIIEIMIYACLVNLDKLKMMGI